VANMYAEDAYLLAPGSPIVQGRSKIQSCWAEAVKAVGDRKFTTVDLKPLAANAALEVGTWTFRSKAQPPQDMNGKYVVVWEKVGSDWKLAIDIWNSDR
jgi:ketosteroid isomerase-like protein